ncbi:hypothetical protein [Sulfurivermis fontis]|uniref:hypothetical protein n=1 Tax=Sulfurivermis fontis TaxID=1972068 RepID=UPI000FD9F0D3|nr:hypothetical protein [Sulfurivermis fontis]
MDIADDWSQSPYQSRGGETIGSTYDDYTEWSQSPYQSRGGETVPSGCRLAQGLRSAFADKMARVVKIIPSTHAPTVGKFNFSFVFSVRANISGMRLSIRLQL